MSTPQSTPFPAKTFAQTGPAAPGQFISFLDGIREELETDEDASQPARVKEKWHPLIRSFLQFLDSLQGPQELPWTTMHETRKTTEVIMDLICLCATRIDSLFLEADDLVEQILLRLLKLCLLLEAWIDEAVPDENGYLSPAELQAKAKDVAVTILRSFGSNVALQIKKKPLYESLKRILVSCVTTCQDLQTPQEAEFPLHVRILTIPRIQTSAIIGESPSLRIDAITGVASMISTILEICICTVSPTLLAHWYLLSAVRSIIVTSREALEFVLSPLCITTPAVRARAVTTISMAMLSRLSVLPGFDGCVDFAWSRLIMYRLHSGGGALWRPLDGFVRSNLDDNSTSIPVPRDVQLIVELFDAENLGEDGDSLRDMIQAYLTAIIPRLDAPNLQVITDAFSSSGDAEGVHASLVQLVQDRISVLSRGTEVHPPTQQLNAEWRSLIRAHVQGLVEPDELAWMDDDHSLSDAQYISRALSEVESRFKRPIYNPAAQARENLAIELGRLPCIIVHGQKSDCSSAPHTPSFDAISVFMHVSVLVLDGPDAEVTAQVRKAVYGALSRTLRHHSSGFGGRRLEHMGELIGRGMKDRDRSVRLFAGQAMVDLIRLYQGLGAGASRRTAPLFATFYRLFETGETYTREAALVTLCRIGRIASAEVLGQTICCLLAQFGQENPVLKGTAYLQIQALSKHYKKSPYNLISPYLDQVAPYLISRLVAKPNLLLECCHLFKMEPQLFIRTTLGRTLPPLFVNCDTKVLEAVSKEMQNSPSELFLEYSHHILAAAFRLQGLGQTNKVLQYIMNTLTDSVQRGEHIGDDTVPEKDSKQFGLESIVKSCIVPLLTELVIGLGEEDSVQAESARTGLNKVERVLKPGTKPTPSKDIGAFLQSYQLGIITVLNDLLQDVYGKRSLDNKKTIVRSIGQLVLEIGQAVSNAAPQIMATLQTMLLIPQLADVTLQSWYIFLTTLDIRDVGSLVGSTSASFLACWDTFSLHGREIAKKCLDYFVFEKNAELAHTLDDIVDLSSIPQLEETYNRLLTSRKAASPNERLRRLLERSASENLTVATQSLQELKDFLLKDNEDFIRSLTSGDAFDPLVDRTVLTLFAAANRDGEGADSLRAIAFDCIGALGAVDPDRIESGMSETKIIVLKNFTDEAESMTFAMHLIQDVLVGAFRSTSDIKYQAHLAYAIQELLKFCKFSPALVNHGSSNSISVKVRNRWNSLPKHVHETITPLLGSSFTVEKRTQDETSPSIPIYPSTSTYREWVQKWTSHLLNRASGQHVKDGTHAKAIFQVFSAVVRDKDVGVARHLLPHLILNILLSRNEADAQDILSELLMVLRDQVEPGSQSAEDKKLLSAQTVFMLMDHLNYWVRIVRQEISGKKADRRARREQSNDEAKEQLQKIDSILSSIDESLMAKAALQCKAYARSLMNFERQVLVLQARNRKSRDLHEYYERLHEIYANLDEPDGMEGVSSLILSPSLEHQIRQHESTGQWTSAQSCWEVRLQQSPDVLDYHVGLLRCLRNLGHYDTMRTHVQGLLTRNPEWTSDLIGFQVESEWMVGNWSGVDTLVEHAESKASPVLLAQVLLALRSGDANAISQALSTARGSLGAPIVAAGVRGYRRCYDAVLDLHLVHELEVIHHILRRLESGEEDQRLGLEKLSQRLSARLDCILPSFRNQEPILSMRRIGFGLSTMQNNSIGKIVGQSWIASAKIARKAGHWQTAYSAMLQAQQYRLPNAFIQDAKLVKAGGEPLRALQGLENRMRIAGLLEDKDKDNDVIDLTEPENNDALKAKAQILRARWMNECDRYEISFISKEFQKAADILPRWESGQFHNGQFHDECFKSLSLEDQLNRGTRMNLQTVRSFAKAMRYGSKYVYQTVPRLLTLWLDMGENKAICKGPIFPHINTEVARAIKAVPMYKWFTAFPQIVSRVGHSNDEVYEVLSKLISSVIHEYPKQALWLFVSVIKSTKAQRGQRGKLILDKLRSQNKNDVSKLINESLRMAEELLALCDHPLQQEERKFLSMQKDFPSLFRLTPSQIIIPLQESLTASLPPPSSASDAMHQPFPVDAPTFARFFDEIEVMRSLAKPRKITIEGSNGQIYMFLGKPKDDLRKDARLMDFNAIINKLLKSNSESRRRQLHIRTYGVVTLNEECGFIQWVPNTVPVRAVLMKAYDRRGIKSWSAEMTKVFEMIKTRSSDHEAADLFVKQILSLFPPVFHEWFIETFPEPTAWLASRLAYSRTAAVMSMVGFILGLGDRHCENILLDYNNGDVVHVDFNCLFEKGKTLETPERVPFRLTNNIVAGFGVGGVEGVFRVACEVTMALLRDNKDTLMSVLDAFIHDPLVEWEDEKRKKDREEARQGRQHNHNASKAGVDLRQLAKDALQPIERKLKGMYTIGRERPQKEISTSSLVRMLIEESMDNGNLARMYPGWAPWH